MVGSFAVSGMGGQRPLARIGYADCGDGFSSGCSDRDPCRESLHEAP